MNDIFSATFFRNGFNILAEVFPASSCLEQMQLWKISAFSHYSLARLKGNLKQVVKIGIAK